MKNFMRQYRNAKKCIAQIRAGEWVPKYHSDRLGHAIAVRGDLCLWISNGAFFLEITDGNLNDLRYFGLFWRHWVWWAAARKLKTDADKAARKYRPMAPVL